MSKLGKCISCGREIDEIHPFCMFCGEKQEQGSINDNTNIEAKVQVKAEVQDYITYPGDIKIKRTTTTLVGVIAVVIMLGVGGYFFIENSTKNNSENNSNNESLTIDEQTSPISKPSSVDKSKDSTYVIKGSEKYPITQEQLKGLSKVQLAMARNEILARHGYVYKSEPYKSYFDSKSWYKANPNFKGRKSDLSPLERHNIKEIMAAEGTVPEANYDSDYHVKKI